MIDGLFDRPLAQHEDETRHPLVHRYQIDPPDVRGMGLRRRRDAGSAGEARERRRSEAEPVLARELDLSELVPDHELLDGRQRDSVGDRLHEEAVAGVSRDPAGARVGMR